MTRIRPRRTVVWCSGVIALAIMLMGTGMASGRTAVGSAGGSVGPAGWSTPPAAVTLPTGQVASPAGRIVALRGFPTGAAVSPDGSTIVAIAGNPATVTTAGLPAMAIEVLDANTGTVRQTRTVVDAFQSVAFSAAGTTVYVAGGGSKVVHTFALGTGGLLAPPVDLAVPGCGFVSGFALTPDGRTLWVACPNDGLLVSLALPSGQPAASVHVPSPDQVAVAPDASTVYATDWRGRTVAAVDTSDLAVTEITVGDHPEAIVALPDGRVVVTDANDATVATISPGTNQVRFTSVALGPGRTDSPNGIAAAPDGRIYVTLGADNAVAVLASTDSADHPWKLEGALPTAWYPTAVAVDPGGSRLEIVTARGLGHSAAATTPFIEPDPAALGVDGAYLTVGALEQVEVPGAEGLRAGERALRAANAPWQPEGDSPLTGGRSGAIRHVIYVTRENKLYDTELGDLTPGPGTPFAIFGQTVTPNLHALARTWVNAVSFYEPAFRSTVGHMWEDAGGPSDLFEREATENYLDPSWTDPTNYPAGGLLVEQAWKAGLSVRTYNEEEAQQSGLLPSQYQAPTTVFPNYDLHYPDTKRELGWESEFTQFEQHRCTGALAATYGASCQLPDLQYVYLGGDHTTVIDKPGYPTIQAQVADNDYATARIIDAVSHSPDWASTLVVVVEDDPQGTGDHVSAYRGPIALASPWVKRGYTTDVHYQWSSVVGAIDRILGLPPISGYAAAARPLDDVFTAQPDFTPFTADPSGTQLYPFTPLPASPVPLPLPFG